MTHGSTKSTHTKPTHKAASKSEQKSVSSVSDDAGATKKKRNFSRGQRRKHLDERLRLLHQRAMVIENELRALEDNRFYRTCIFGSARIKPNTHAYDEAFELAHLLARDGIDVLTGGGPGLMEAANKGAKLGREESRAKSLSLGLTIQLEWEPEPNHHLDVKRHHMRFSSRLDDFMRLSHSIIVTPGGIGTVLEVFFTWQLIQVKHMESRPIVFLGKKFWKGLLEWMRERPLADGLVSEKDFDVIKVADSPAEAYKIIAAHHAEFRRTHKRGPD
ncbi:MAG: LOG family protein [Oligoflexia bacterium]|nr:LOG family protein [Oligoflexia bacterium]